MKYRHISAQPFVFLMLVINHLFPALLNSKPLLRSPYTMLTNILFYRSLKSGLERK